MSSLAILDDLRGSKALADLADRKITREQYEALGEYLGDHLKTVQWAVGDYLVAGPVLFGDDAYQLQEALGISPESKAQYIRVAERIEPERRRNDLSWSHHRSVASLEPADQDAWLDRAAANGWTRGEMDAHIRGLPELVWKPDTAALIAAATAVVKESALTVEERVYEVPMETLDELGSVLGIVSA